VIVRFPAPADRSIAVHELALVATITYSEFIRCSPLHLARWTDAWHRVAPVPTVRETLRGFVRALREGTDFPVTIQDGLQTVALVDAAYRSAARGGDGATVTS